MNPLRTLEQQVRREWEARLIKDLRAHIKAAKFDAAFSTAELLLEFGPSAEGWEVLVSPMDLSSTGMPKKDLYELLHRLDTTTMKGHTLWRNHLRLGLLQMIGWSERANMGAERIQVPERYGWMRFLRAHFLRNQFAHEQAMADYDATLKAAPTFWKAGANMAECALCLDREDEAFRIFDDVVDRARRGTSHDLAAALVWRGELRLWVGQYEQALADFEASGTGSERHPTGAAVLVLCWRGAARLMLGRLQPALDDLERAVHFSPADAEAITWRAEAHARLEHWDAALADFDHAARITPAAFWPLLGRALLRARAGDEQGFWSDYDRLPDRVMTFFEWAFPTEARRDMKKAVAMLETVRTAARGIRRSDVYMYPLWLRGPDGRLRAIR